VPHAVQRASPVEAHEALSGIDLRVRPIYHRLEDPVRAHIFLCLLAYYVEWHMRKALACLLYDDEELDVKRPKRDAVAPARPSASAAAKRSRRKTPEGFPVQSFETLLSELATRCRNKCVAKGDSLGSTIQLLTQPTSLQSRALHLLGLYPVPANSHQS